MSLSMSLRLGFATLTSLAFLVFTFKDIQGQALGEAIAGLNVWLVLLYLLGLCMTQVARAVRWGMLIAPFAPLPWRKVWHVSNLGNMLIMLLPLRLGEFARPMMMRKMCGASTASGMGAAVVERVLDGLLVTLLFFAVTWEQQGAVVSQALQTGALVALAIFVAALMSLGLAVLLGDKLESIVVATVGQVLPTLAGRITTMFQAFLLGLRAVPDGRTLLGVVGWTVAYWAANALGLWALMLAFGQELPAIAAFTVVCVLVIGVMIPAGPGLLGTYQAAIMAGLSIYNVDKTISAALSVVAYLGNLGVIVAFGLPYVWRGQALGEALHDCTDSSAVGDLR